MRRGNDARAVQAAPGELFCIPVERRITLVGIGMGPVNNMTKEAYETCREAQLLIGARRMTQKIAEASQEVFHAYRPQEIANYIDAHPEFEKIAIALSGMSAFTAGAEETAGSIAGWLRTDSGRFFDDLFSGTAKTVGGRDALQYARAVCQHRQHGEKNARRYLPSSETRPASAHCAPDCADTAWEM